jgi:hypothetical protein
MIRHSCQRSVIQCPPAAEFQDCLRIEFELTWSELDLTGGDHDDTVLVRWQCRPMSASRRVSGLHRHRVRARLGDFDLTRRGS